MSVEFSIDGGDPYNRGCFGLILRGLMDGNLWQDDDEEEGSFVPETITFERGGGFTMFGVAGRSSPEEWAAFYADIYPTMEGVSEILSLEELQIAGELGHVTMNVAAEFGKERTFLPMVLHLVRLPYAAPWVARMYREIKDKWPQLSAVDCFQLACAVSPALPDDKDETRILNFHPAMGTTNRDSNRPFNALTDVRLGQTMLKPCPRAEAFSVTQFAVKGGSSTTHYKKLARIAVVPGATTWRHWARDVIDPKLTPQQRASVERNFRESWGGDIEAYTIAGYFGPTRGIYQAGKFSHTCEQAIEEVMDVFFGGKKK